jgi:cell division protein FtsN
MKKDYAKHRSPYKAPAKSSPGWLWMLMGMTLGLALAAIAYFKPNLSTITRVEHLVHHEKVLIKSSVSKPVQTASQTPPAPKFDFYSVLPNQQLVLEQSDNKPVVSKSTPMQVVQANPAALQHPSPVVEQPSPSSTSAPPVAANPSPAPVVAVTTPTPSQQTTLAKTVNKPEHFIIQIGIYKTANEADHVKAELALQGFSVKMSTMKTANGKKYQLFLGPYKSKQSAENTRSQLAANQISCAVQKVSS